jgi:hypothetical protein
MPEASHHSATGEDRVVTFMVRFEEYRFAGIVQRTIVIYGTVVSGTATEQRTGGWAWFLRYPNGDVAGKGRYGSWGGVLCGIKYAVAQETRHGQLSSLRRGAAPPEMAMAEKEHPVAMQWWPGRIEPMGMDPKLMARLREQASDDQRQAALRDYIACEDGWRRWPLLALLVGRRPTGADWRRWEARRAESRRLHDAQQGAEASPD